MSKLPNSGKNEVKMCVCVCLSLLEVGGGLHTKTQAGPQKLTLMRRHTFIHALGLIFIECNIHSIDLFTHMHSLSHAPKNTQTNKHMPPPNTHTVALLYHMLFHSVLI